MDDETAARLFPPDATFRYGPAEEQRVELFLPEGKGPFPVVAFIYGGCWHSKFGKLAGARSTFAMLAHAGLGVWGIGYRPLDQGGQYPGIYDDIEAASNLLAKNARRYHLDMSRVVLAGHSAGAELAEWAAGQKNIPARSVLAKKSKVRFKALVSINGPGDLAPIAKLADQVCGAGTFAMLTGPVSAARPDPLADTSPVQLLPLGIPIYLISAANDHVVPTPLVEAYAEAARKAGDHVTLTIIPNASHVDPVEPQNKAFETTLDVLVKAVNGR
ncbi:MAG TPA: alpha/beta hydrolase [Sphingomicrobium sp.]|nr:alpha/beta hydrolase [Sphingomicrobium sp.]